MSALEAATYTALGFSGCSLERPDLLSFAQFCFCIYFHIAPLAVLIVKSAPKTKHARALSLVYGERLGVVVTPWPTACSENSGLDATQSSPNSSSNSERMPTGGVLSHSGSQNHHYSTNSKDRNSNNMTKFLAFCGNP